MVLLKGVPWLFPKERKAPTSPLSSSPSFIACHSYEQHLNGSAVLQTWWWETSPLHQYFPKKSSENTWHIYNSEFWKCILSYDFFTPQLLAEYLACGIYYLQYALPMIMNTWRISLNHLESLNHYKQGQFGHSSGGEKNKHKKQQHEIRVVSLLQRLISNDTMESLNVERSVINAIINIIIHIVMK